PGVFSTTGSPHSPTDSAGFPDCHVRRFAILPWPALGSHAVALGTLMTRQLASPLPVEVAPMRLPRPGKTVRRPDSGPRLRLEHLESREVPAAIGILDPSFGTGGKVAVFPTTGSIGGVAVDVAGRTVLAGSFPGAGGF